ncbi:hypothetical protein D9611_012068 [Ephemerocybe angulata]|uniref:Carboxylic ester hydrolase n=1 Tax=Ephemerocybe angulata TaxID=980116 RepID=A0A8H5ASP0_9AGAR|nr:hypothetical protein D9611_012068 [Tulosesus angulatus]
MLKVAPFMLALAIGVQALPQVHVGKTTVTGRVVSDEVEFFGGLPYAEPPLGALRLRKPISKTQLGTLSYNASSHGNACLQPLRLPDPPLYSEDCLFVNIYRPKNTLPSGNLPVLFWTYGGAFTIGASDQADGKDIVARSIARGTPIIYVNFNYRLGPLGFPQGQEADDHKALNLGSHDQIAALQWVQANIRNFGGDGRKVTIFGKSAGAILTSILWLNPQVEKLARAAIFESGAPNSPSTFPAARNEPVWQNFVRTVPSCANVSSSGHTFACLQKAPTEEIAAAVRQTSFLLDVLPLWAPTVDSREDVYPDYVSRLYAKGKFSHLPFITGTNRDEGTIFASQQALSEQGLEAMLLELHSPPTTTARELNSTLKRILELYPEDPIVGSPYGTGTELFGLPPSYKRTGSLKGDLFFDAPRRQLSQAAAKSGVKSYVYHFTHPQLNLTRTGVDHSAEIAFVYGQTPASDPVAQNLSTVMMDYWISFAVSLNPNDGKGVKRPEWPQYTTKDQVLLQLEGGNTTAVKDDYRKEQIEYLIRKSLVLHR